MGVTAQGTSRKRKQPSRFIDTYAAQCVKCYKWRFIDSEEKYEDIRSKSRKNPFQCEDCQEPQEVDVECDSTRVWFVDHLYGLPKTPQGFKRLTVARVNYDKADVYYVTPEGKKLRSTKELAGFIEDNENYKDIKIEDVSFAAPKLMNKTKVKDVAAVNKKDKNGKKLHVSVSDFDHETSAEGDDPIEERNNDDDQKIVDVQSDGSTNGGNSDNDHMIVDVQADESRNEDFVDVSNADNKNKFLDVQADEKTSGEITLDIREDDHMIFDIQANDLTNGDSVEEGSNDDDHKILDVQDDDDQKIVDVQANEKTSKAKALEAREDKPLDDVDVSPVPKKRNRKKSKKRSEATNKVIESTSDEAPKKKRKRNEKKTKKKKQDTDNKKDASWGTEKKD